jgi:GAF domain-containing protein
MVLASLVLEQRQWFKAYSGLTGDMLAERGTIREWSFCQHVVEGAAPLIVPDAREHPLFAENPLVKQGVVTGYAGAPLTTATGDVLGSLCLIDQRPLDIDPAGIARLVKAARRVAGELEVRALRQKGAPKASLDPEAAQRALPYLEATLGALEEAIVLLGPSGRAVLANPSVKTLFGIAPGALRAKTRDEIVDQLATAFANPAEIERLQIATTGPGSSAKKSS